MKSLRIDLLGCYGIRSLDEQFDFSDGRRHVAVYASNGTVKSSLARTFADIGRGESKDRIFEREYRRSITDNEGRSLSEDRILVIRPYGDTKDAAKASSGILASGRLRSDYDKIRSGLEGKRESLVRSLSRMSGLAEDRVAEALLRDFGRDRAAVESLYDLIEELDGADPDEFASLRDISYGAVFSDRASRVINAAHFRQHRVEYMEKYNRLLDKSLYLKRFFDLSRAATARKRLLATNFFKAGHRVSLVSPEGDADIDRIDEDQFETILEDEEKSVDAKALPEWKKISDDLSATAETRKFLDAVSANRSLLAELDDPGELRKKLWMAYLTTADSPARALAAEYRTSRDRIGEITRAANDEVTAWDKVVKKYNKRFKPHFRLSATNRAKTLLGDDALRLEFTFVDDDGSEKVLDQARLEDTLSEGERRAFYILNALFEVEGRIERRQETVIVVDDIADSFDYKNKHAIVQYLKEVSGHGFFHLLILTHNFDFFRNVLMRGIVGYDKCYYARRDNGRITLHCADSIRDPLRDLTRRLDGGKNQDNHKHLVAAIPFARSMIGYADGAGGDEYAILSSMLHYRHTTDTTTVGQVLDTINGVFPKAKASPNPPICRNDKAIDLVDRAAAQARESAEDPTGLDLVDKVVMSIYIRVAAERFMARTVHGGNPGEDMRDRTPDLVEEYTKCAIRPGCEPSEAILDTLDRVVLMTPEIIHLNAFMYEPILDMPADSLASLYDDVCALGEEAGALDG